jgi:hypothetical protein
MGGVEGEMEEDVVVEGMVGVVVVEEEEMEEVGVKEGYDERRGEGIV